MPTSNDSSARDATRSPAGKAAATSHGGSARDAARPAGAAPSDCVYVIQLHSADPASLRTLVGRLEHVLSGRRHDFDTGAALLGCLRQEQTHVLATRNAKR